MSNLQNYNVYFLYFQVLSLPSNFTYNPPGSERISTQRHPSTGSQGRRKTLHGPQTIFLSHLDDIKNIDESTSDLYNIQETVDVKNLEDRNKSLLHIETNFDDIITINQHTENLLKVKENEENNLLKISEKDISVCPPSKILKEREPHKPSTKTIKENILSIPAETKPTKTSISLTVPDAKPPKIKENVLMVPMEQKPLHKLYGSTKHLFRQKSMDVCSEQTPFLLSAQQSTEESDKSEPAVSIELRLQDTHDTVQRIISERRKLDGQLKEVEDFDIFERTHDSRECLTDREVTQISSSVFVDHPDIAEDLC